MTTERRGFRFLWIFAALVAAATALEAALTYALMPRPGDASAAASAPARVESGGDGVTPNGAPSSEEIGLIGFAGRVIDSKKPKLTAYFERESYAPGASALLVVTDTARGITLRMFRAGGENRPTLPRDVMLGTPVDRPVAIGSVHGRRVVSVRIGDWPSGVYFARLVSGKRVGYATFVLRPARLGEHRIAVVIPTQTWQAYNFRDDNGDGRADTWYTWRTSHARLIRAFLDRGVPPHWKAYDAPFIRWITHSPWKVDYLSDAELRAVPNGRALADAYTLMIFEGHHEYVTTHEYDVVTEYRDLGGNLAFLSANDFFWKITLDGTMMTRMAEWRSVDRPEAALIGVEYLANDEGTHRGPWLIRDTSSTPWLFAGTELAPDDPVASGGIEIDHTAPSSPAGVHVIAEIPDLFGPGYTAQMTYYETKGGAKVFAAGAFELARVPADPDVSALLTNLLTKLSTP
jgi:N,N-dimethylformamidase beta subunit-like protein